MVPYKIFLYDITIAIDPSVEEEWLQWMHKEHIPEVMDTGKFTEQGLFRVVASGQGENLTSYSMKFYGENMKELQLYADIHTPELQQKINQRWPDKLTAFRTKVESIDANPLVKSLDHLE